MTISISVKVVTDVEIQILKSNAIPAQSLLMHVRSFGQGYLDGYWRALHGFLTQDGKITTLPAAAFVAGDVYLPQIERGAHAIFADTNINFAALLWRITEEDIHAYVKKHERDFLASHLVSSIEEFEQEFWHFFTHLRESSYSAREAQCGLIFIKWEE